MYQYIATALVQCPRHHGANARRSAGNQGRFIAGLHLSWPVNIYPIAAMLP
jgi:hypothetical protein